MKKWLDRIVNKLSILWWVIKYEFAKTRYKVSKPNPTQKDRIAIKFHHTPPYKYLYSFLKGLNHNNVQVFLIPTFAFYWKLDIYGKSILSDCDYTLSFLRPKACFLLVDKVSPNSIYIQFDYLNGMQNPNPEQFTFPLLMHPFVYKENLHHSLLGMNTKKHITLLFCGNCNPYYDTVFAPKYFGVPNRIKTIEFIKERFQTYSPVDASLHTLMKDPIRLAIINSKKNSFGTSGYLKLVGASKFFLALPGYRAPTCHNVYEAIALGSVPIIHKNLLPFYGSLLIENYNCLSYNNLENLAQLLKKLLVDPDLEYAKRVKNLAESWERHIQMKMVISNFQSKLPKLDSVNLFYDSKSLSLYTKEIIS